MWEDKLGEEGRRKNKRGPSALFAFPNISVPFLFFLPAYDQRSLVLLFPYLENYLDVWRKKGFELGTKADLFGVRIIRICAYELK
jgi:hypothetical protein